MAETSGINIEWMLNPESLNDSQLFLMFLHKIWATTLEKHPFRRTDCVFTGGFKEDPGLCCKATAVLCDLHALGSLNSSLGIQFDEDGLVEFEWYYSNYNNCSLLLDSSGDMYFRCHVNGVKHQKLHKISNVTEIEQPLALAAERYFV